MYGAIVYIFRFCRYWASHYLKGFRGRPGVAGPGGGGGGGGAKKKKNLASILTQFFFFFLAPPPPPQILPPSPVQGAGTSEHRPSKPRARLTDQASECQYLLRYIYIYICKGFRPQAKEQDHKYT